jgi:hypothetical protein
MFRLFHLFHFTVEQNVKSATTTNRNTGLNLSKPVLYFNR